jgi:cytochrome c oxidase subunit 4
VNPIARKLGAVWLALLVLLALTCGSAFIPMGVWNSVANFGIAIAKALLVAWFFMHLSSARAVHRLVAIAALFTLSLLVALTFADYATRVRYPAPWQAPASPR